MEIKLGLLIKSRNALEKLNDTEGIDALTAYRISKNIKEIGKELSIYDEQHLKLLNTYCEKNDGKPILENGMVKVIGENFKKYESELSKIFDENVEVSIKKISLESILNVGLSPAQIGSIEYMLETED